MDLHADGLDPRLNRPALRSVSAPAAARVGWVLFGWATEPMNVLVVYFIFVPYATTVVIADPVLGQTVWGLVAGAGGLLVAVLGPILGAKADRDGRRKRWIAMFSVLGAAGAALLWLAEPDASPVRLVVVIAAGVAAIVGVEVAGIFHSAMLPDIASPSRMGRLSGLEAALAVVAGLSALVAVLVAFTLPDAPAFGLDKARHEHDRIVGPIAALCLVIFALPLIMLAPDGMPGAPRQSARLAERWRLFTVALAGLRAHRNVALYLVARTVYADGIGVALMFGTIYAAATLNWDSTGLGLFGIVVLAASAVGAFAGGWIDDRLGSRRAILIALCGILLSLAGLLSVTSDSVLFVVPIQSPGAAGTLFSTEAERVFIGFAVLLGLCIGPAHAASRTMLARIAPPGRMAQVFGIMKTAGKATAFIGPLLVGLVTAAAGSQRGGLAVAPALVLAGLAILALVREERNG